MVWDVFDYLWEENYSAAVRYHREYGNLDVPYNYVDSEGIKLGQWLNGLRSCRRGTARKAAPLTDEQIARLDALGMIWGNKVEKRWNEDFQALCEYHKKNGTFDIPVAYKTESGINLGAWIRYQRDVYADGKLSDEHTKMLRDIGFVLEKSDPWEEKYQLAKAYFEEHGNLNPPAQYVVNGVWLSKWLNEQKLMAEGKRKKMLSAEQLEKLESIGFRYGTTLYEELWNERYEMARAYFEEHGDLNIPKDYIVNDFQLGTWIRQQKKQYLSGNLSDEHFRLLTAIGMEWENGIKKRVRESYETGFQHLEAFIAENGVRTPSLDTVCEDGYKLGGWISNCKSKYRTGKLAKKHITHFEKLGIQLEKSDPWEERYQEVKAYLEANGITYIPIGTIGESGYDLYSWVTDQRKFDKSGTLSEDRKKKLVEIGYPFLHDKSARDENLKQKWLNKANTVLEYVQSHDPDELTDDTEYSGIRIMHWLKNQQSRLNTGKITDSGQAELLQRILQLSLYAKSSHWEKMYESAVQYFAEHGEITSIPHDYEVSDGNLKAWIKHETRIVRGIVSSDRTPEQLEKLAKIGITPDMKSSAERQWDSKFEQIKGFVADKGRLPFYSKGRKDEFPLALWINNQKKKAKQGLLTEKQLFILRELGIKI